MTYCAIDECHSLANRGDLCPHHIEHRPNDLCMGKCGARVLAWWATCGSCTIKSGPMTELAKVKQAASVKVRKPRTARQRRELEAYARMKGTTTAGLLGLQEGHE